MMGGEVAPAAGGAAAGGGGFQAGARSPKHTDGGAPPQFVAFEIADALLSSGFVGMNLSKLLQLRFPNARRAEFCLGVAIFATDMHAELLIAEVELHALRKELAALKGRR
jgi:hypothetical protein